MNPKNISREGSRDGGDFEITINQFLFFKIVPNWLNMKDLTHGMQLNMNDS